VTGRSVLILVLVGVALLFVVDSATATPGALDAGFGLGGIVTTTIASGSTVATALAVQPDGKIVAGGETAVGSETQFALARYNLNGTLDTSFGSAGKLTTAVGSGGSDIRALVLQSDGKIIVAGGADSGLALARYNPDGSLDTSFGTGGKVVTAVAVSGGAEAHAIALQTDGKIVVGGSNGDSSDFVLARYNPNGTLDTSFGTDGIVITATGYLTALALQPDGKIVAAGGPRFTVARYNPDGSLDTSFGTGGTVTTDLLPGFEQANGVVLQPDGKIVVGGTLGGHLGLLRYSTSGALDPTFGSMVTGFILPAFGQALVQQPDGKLVLTGYADGTEHAFALARYNASDGSPDPSFGSGITTTPIGAYGGAAYAVGLEPDGKIVAGGVAETGSNDTTGDQFAIARYQVTSTLTTSTAGNGSGVVTSSPAGIDCGMICTDTFAQAVPVTLTATPAAGSLFTGWQGGEGCSGTTGSCAVVMTSDRSLTATFTLAETLSITKSGSGTGKVTSTPAGIHCGPSCAHSYAYGTTVTLTASPAANSTFKGWSGACSGTGTCSVTMKQARSTEATFAAKPACIVPMVLGKRLATAKRKVKRAHCRTGEVRRRSSPLRSGIVISQKPQPRKHLRNGARINLVVSKGSRP
jgi:uncharacterized delta-60 repeat protein